MFLAKFIKILFYQLTLRGPDFQKLTIFTLTLVGVLYLMEPQAGSFRDRKEIFGMQTA